MNKRVFGYNVTINLNGYCMELVEELSHYPDIATNRDNLKTLQIDFVNYVDEKCLSSNPSIFILYEDGFSMNLDYAEIRWVLNDLDRGSIKVSFKVKNNTEHLIKKNVKRFRSIGYEIFPENIGQILHELVFVPATFIFHDKIIIHGSCLYNKVNDKSIVFGGTGGVGKTATILSLAKSDEWLFLSDDIVVVDKAGVIYPNYAYPKIYAYNTLGHEQLENKLLSQMNFLDKAQWVYRKKRNSSSVRRRIAPSTLYDTFYQEVQLTSNLFIFRGDFQSEINIEKIDNTKSAELEEAIILPEYEAFFRYLRWYSYNLKVMGKIGYSNSDKFFIDYKKNYQDVFSLNDNYVVKVKANIKKNKFTEKMTEMINDLLIF